MNTKTMALAALVLWMLTILGAVYLFTFGRTRESSDTRTTIVLTSPEHALLLREMRDLLGSLNGAAGALARGDDEQAARFVEKSGMAMVNSLELRERTILAKLPMPMKQLGLATHREMDILAARIRHHEPMNGILGQIEIVTSKCIACHAMYRAVSE